MTWLIHDRYRKWHVSLSLTQTDAGDGSVCQPKGHCKGLKKFIIAGVVAATATLGLAERLAAALVERMESADSADPFIELV
jgi:hypothetical protein